MNFLTDKLEDIRQTVNELILDNPTNLQVHFSYSYREAGESIASGSVSTMNDASLLLMYLRNFEKDLANLRAGQHHTLFEIGSKVVCIDNAFPENIGDLPKRNQEYVVQRIIRDFFDTTPFLVLEGLQHQPPYVGYIAHKFMSVADVKNDNYKNN